MGNLAYDAMVFAREKHQSQVRKYLGNPYSDHLAEVAGIVSTAAHNSDFNAEVLIATAWLHDCVEDQSVTAEQLSEEFGSFVCLGVMALSDMELGNRAERKEASRYRLSKASGWIQTIKCADLISNTSNIMKQDPTFAVTYLKEKRMLLDVLTQADPRLLAMARALAEV